MTISRYPMQRRRRGQGCSTREGTCGSEAPREGNTGPFARNGPIGLGAPCRTEHASGTPRPPRPGLRRPHRPTPERPVAGARPTTSRGCGVRTHAYGRPTEMSSPRHIEAGAPRARRTAVAIVTALSLACPSFVALTGIAAAGDTGTETDVKQTKEELRDAKERVRARRAKIRTLQRHLNALATRISKAQAEIDRTEAQIAVLQRKMTALRARADLLQSKLDERNRAAYMFGGASVMFVLTATSAADAASRMSFL